MTQSPAKRIVLGLALGLAMGSIARAEPAVISQSGEVRVAVHIAGLDARAAQAAIVRGARTACWIALRDTSLINRQYNTSSCIDDAVTEAESNLATTKASRPNLASR
jgi:hypothetical protein